MSAEITTRWVPTSKVIFLCILQRLRVQCSRCREEVHAVLLSMQLLLTHTSVITQTSQEGQHFKKQRHVITKHTYLIIVRVLHFSIKHQPYNKLLSSLNSFILNYIIFKLQLFCPGSLLNAFFSSSLLLNLFLQSGTINFLSYSSTFLYLFLFHLFLFKFFLHLFLFIALILLLFLNAPNVKHF